MPMRSKLWSEQPGRLKDGDGRFGIEAVEMGSMPTPKGELQGPESRLYVPAHALQPRGSMSYTCQGHSPFVTIMPG